MKRVLVPVDGSAASLRAVAVAIQAVMNSKLRTEVHLLTIQAPVLSGNVTRFFALEEINDFYQEEGRDAQVTAEELLKKADIEYDKRILVGSPAPTITTYAEQHECDHIIMGTRGLGAVTSLVLGSVATKVLSLSKIPVTLVP